MKTIIGLMKISKRNLLLIKLQWMFSNFCFTKITFLILLLFLFAGCQILLAHEIHLPRIFSNNMVIQREKHISIWGNADPGKIITVRFAGESAMANVDSNGKWMAKLPRMKAGGPFTMIISDDKDSVIFHNVMIGDVWVASGQSNMLFPLAEAKCHKKAIANANHPNIRLFVVPLSVSNYQKHDLSSGSWRECSPETVQYFSAVAYFFSLDIYKNINVPIGIIESAVGGTPAQYWVSKKMLKTIPQYAQGLNHLKNKPYYWSYPIASKEGGEALKRFKDDLSFLFNAMIAPLIPYTLRGVIWYQGENNVDNPTQYRTLFPKLIQDWRIRWKQGYFPFLYVQIANWNAHINHPVDHSPWSELREAQLMTLKESPNTAMVVTTDTNDSTSGKQSMHPKRKEVVGKRLALAALHIAYGKNIVYSGPLYQSMKVKGNKIYLNFTHTGTGLIVKHAKKLKGFSISGKDKRFYWAKAIIKNNQVIVWNSRVKHPMVVRYDWQSNPWATLFNKEGLPASPFRTSDWENSNTNKE